MRVVVRIHDGATGAAGPALLHRVAVSLLLRVGRAARHGRVGERLSGAARVLVEGATLTRVGDAPHGRDDGQRLLRLHVAVVTRSSLVARRARGSP